MKTRNSLLDMMATSAAAATRLYFDPLRRLRLVQPLFGQHGISLSPLGKILLTCSTVTLIAALIWAQFLNQAVAQRRVNELLQNLFSQTAEAAMTTPERPTQLPKAPTSDSIQILYPKDNSIVSSVESLQGRVSAGSAEVWIIVHPLETSSYWVQPKVNLSHNGFWSSMIFLGRSDSIDSGKQFEIRAVLNPKTNLREGQVVESWPDANAVSAPVILVRK